jgi:hypothetical protein
MHPEVKEPRTYFIDDVAPTLKQLQDMVYGYIEVVHCKDTQIVINEEGKLLGLSPNLKATEVWLGKDKTKWHDVIAGNAVVLTGSARIK